MKKFVVVKKYHQFSSIQGDFIVDEYDTFEEAIDSLKGAIDTLVDEFDKGEHDLAPFGEEEQEVKDYIAEQVKEMNMDTEDSLDYYEEVMSLYEEYKEYTLEIQESTSFDMGDYYYVVFGIADIFPDENIDLINMKWQIKDGFVGVEDEDGVFVY